PEDVAFIGFTDGILSKLATPSLTSVAQHGERMGKIAARMLIEKIERDDEKEFEEETFRTEVIEATLIERESTIN
ncbi:substrate-binding domain-containing protein, partial [Eudoraea sp.]|uniref:substrate-binding domain-containing protein n=1 Tax=Eudoraea sp. TaxID=1979955 RepID=UPI003C77F0C6